MFVCVCVCLCVCVCVVRVFDCVYMYVCSCVRVFCACRVLYVCMCVYVCVCACIVSGCALKVDVGHFLETSRLPYTRILTSDFKAGVITRQVRNTAIRNITSKSERILLTDLKVPR